MLTPANGIASITLFPSSADPNLPFLASHYALAEGNFQPEIAPSTPNIIAALVGWSDGGYENTSAPASDRFQTVFHQLQRPGLSWEILSGARPRSLTAPTGNSLCLLGFLATSLGQASSLPRPRRNLSVLSFMQQLWHLPVLGGVNRLATDLFSSFDFSQRPQPPSLPPVGPPGTLFISEGSGYSFYYTAAPGVPVRFNMVAETPGLDIGARATGEVRLTVTGPPAGSAAPVNHASENPNTPKGPVRLGSLGRVVRCKLFELGSVVKMVRDLADFDRAGLRGTCFAPRRGAGIVSF